MKNFIFVLSSFTFSLALWGADSPRWVNSPADYCGSSKLCAVGESTGRMMAETEARNALAKIFETKIKATTTATTTSESTMKDDVVEGKVEEEYYSQIKEFTEETLEGVEVKEFHDDGEAVFALAVLDKNKAARRLQSRMAKLDDDIASLYEDNRRASINKALKIFVVRDNLDNKHDFLVGRSYPPRVSKRKLLNAKKAKKANSVVVLLEVDELSETNELRNIVIDELLKNDLKVVTASTLKHQFKVVVSLSGEKQHMNVKGFEKYKFLLSFVSKDTSGNKIGSLNFDHVSTGRSLTQAYTNALGKIKSFITENIGELNID